MPKELKKTMDKEPKKMRKMINGKNENMSKEVETIKRNKIEIWS